jgi:protein-L-isoaspartate O-methyltransferase
VTTEYTATYSPEDNKLRLYAGGRLGTDEYERVRAAGFRWAAKQELFVAPMWTPAREDLLIEMCGEIGDEDTSLVERAEQRAERFGGYQENRARDAHQAKDAVKAISENIPLGQPILVGHHSQKKAERDAKKIEQGMAKAVKMWETSQYWQDRAAGVLRSASYKAEPTVRARRIKKIEADKRKSERNKAAAENIVHLWSVTLKNKEGHIADDWQKAGHITGRYCRLSMCFPADKYPRKEGQHVYEGPISLYSALDDEIINPQQAKALSIASCERGIAYNERWIAHYENRLTYEKALLEADGASALLDKPKRRKQPPILNYKADTITYQGFSGDQTIIQVEMTKAEYTKLGKDSRWTLMVDGTHRVKSTSVLWCPDRIKKPLLEGKETGTAYHNAAHQRVAVFLTDSKVHDIPEPEPEPDNTEEQARIKAELDALDKADAEKAARNAAPESPKTTYTPPERTEFDAMKESLEAGISTVSAPQLFPTPPDIAAQVVELAEIEPGQTVLEPSIGTGSLVQAVIDTVDTEIVGYEINTDLVRQASSKFPDWKLQARRADFLEVTDGQGQFPRIIMNPPFERGSDIKHIEHAKTFLRPGGRLVAICANGPRQQEKLKPQAEQWIDLGPGRFQGTNVNTALCVIDAPLTEA